MNAPIKETACSTNVDLTAPVPVNLNLETLHVDVTVLWDDTTPVIGCLDHLN